MTTPASPQSSEQASQDDSARDADGVSSDMDSLLAQPQTKQRGRKRQWVSDTFQTLLDSVGGGGEAGDGPASTALTDRVSIAVGAAVGAGGGSDQETAQELERLLGEVSSCEGKLLDLSSSIPDEGQTD